MRARHEASFKKAQQSRIPIALGTDAGTPFNHHGENAQELTRMVALGMSPMEAIMAATSSAAELLGIEQLVGTIQAGKVADLVLVEGNPLKRISLVQDKTRLAGVMQAGRFVGGPLSH
jgi:imidazolonepropionase-like amidohydrolase